MRSMAYAPRDAGWRVLGQVSEYRTEAGFQPLP